MKKKWRVKISLILILILVLGWGFYFTLGRSLLDQAYHGQSMEFFNKLISGQGEHALDHYYKIAERVLGKLSVYALCALAILWLPVPLRLMTGSTLVLFVILEIILQVQNAYLNKKYYELPFHEEIFFEHHPVLGWRNRPGAGGFYVNRYNRIKEKVIINSKGLRDDEYSYEKPAQTKRLLLIGDSVIQGLEVAQDELIDKQLEQLLAGHGIVEVINAGTRGYGTDQSYLLWKEELHKYKPDGVIYTFVFNDPEDTIMRHKPGRKFGKSSFVIENGQMVLGGAPVPEEFPQNGRYISGDPKVQKFYNEREARREQAAKKSESNVTVAQLIVKDIRKTKLFHWIELKVRRIPALKRLFAHAGLIESYAGEREEVLPAHILDRQWDLIGRLIGRMQKLADEAHIPFLVYEFTSRGDEPQPTRLQKLCAAYDIAYLNHFNEFKKESKARAAYRFPFDDHWNTRGHKFAAYLLYQYLKEQHWLGL